MKKSANEVILNKTMVRRAMTDNTSIRRIFGEETMRCVEIGSQIDFAPVEAQLQKTRK